MNYSLSAAGSRADVLKYLRDISGAATMNAQPAAAPPAAPRLESSGIPQGGGADVTAMQGIVSALATYIESAPEGADAFTVQANVYVGWQSPTT